MPQPALAQDACARSEPGELAYSLGLEAVRAEGESDVTASFRLVQSTRPRDVAMLVFADGIQILGPDPVLRVACGDTARWATRVAAGEGVPLDLHVTAHPSPSVPDAFGDPADPSEPIPNQVDALRYAYDAADVGTTAFGPPRDPPEGTFTSAAERLPAPMADAYLFDDDPASPTHVRVLEPGERRWSFHIWFAETLKRDGRFGIVCLLDDRQFDAFAGRPLWFGALALGEAAVIEARTPPLAPGWHQVRCLVLDSLFEGAERGPAWPYVIRSTFVYARP